MHLKAITKGPAFVRSRSHDTRRNLPRASAQKRMESNFLRKFEQVYLAAEGVANVASREFAVEGFGRADLVWVAWRTQEADEFTALSLRKRVRLTAIEGKVSDWRKGVQQAFRYRYFAHRSLLVLPMETARTASKFLNTFRRLRVGLWGFDTHTGRIQKWCTPRAATPFNRKAWEKALHLFESKLDFRKFPKRR